MAAVHPAGPLPRMMILECFGVLAVMVRLQLALRQSRVWPCHIVMASRAVKAGGNPSRCIRLYGSIRTHTSERYIPIREILLRGPRARVIAPDPTSGSPWT